MRAIRAGRGLGDALYMQSIVRDLIADQSERIEVCTDWDDLFAGFGDMVRLAPFRRERVHLISHYTSRKKSRGTDQFQDCCLNCGIAASVDLRLEWTPRSDPFWDARRPVVVVQMPRAPFARTDGFGRELLPQQFAVQRAINALQGRATVVQIGKGKPLYELEGIDIDLANRTTVAELLDVACAADAFLGYVSFMVPLAESLKRPALFIWSRRGRNSSHHYINTITPQKILHRPELSQVAWDDWGNSQIDEAVNALLEAVGSRGAVSRQVSRHSGERAGVSV